MASTSSITSLGVGSGLDAESIVTKLVALERAPITQLQNQADKIQTKISAFGKIQSLVSSVQTAARKLTSPDLWGSTTATSSNSAAVSFSTSAGAAAGNYSVNVTSLAAGQAVVMATAQTSSSVKLGAGTITLDKGSWNGTTFTSTGSATLTIAATDTLQDIQDKINASGAGVQASMVTDASGSRLIFTSSQTGAANGFRITTSDADGNNTDANGLSMLAYDPANATAGTNLTQSSADAKASVNGVEVTSTSNTFSNVLTGITFTVGQLTTAGSPVNVAITSDTTTISKAIKDFASAYTDMVNEMLTDTKYDSSTKEAGPLQGDGTALALLNQFRTLMGSSTGASSTFTTLSSIGVSIQSGGTLKVDDTKLTNALGNLAEVKKLFANADGSNSANDGIATRLRSLTTDMLAFDGALANRTNGLRSDIANKEKQQDKLDARATLYEKRLRAQYTALDTTMASLNTTSNYVTQMINGLNK